MISQPSSFPGFRQNNFSRPSVKPEPKSAPKPVPPPSRPLPPVSVPKAIAKPNVKPAPTPSGLFGRRQIITRQELKNVLKKDSGIIPKSYHKFNPKDRMRLEAEFGTRARDYIYRSDIEKRLKKVEYDARWKTPNANEKIRLEERARYLRRLLSGQ